MRKSRMIFLAALLLMLLWAAPAPAEEPAEWTVMFYLCGSDLESRHGYATGNLEEIMECFPYAVLYNATLEETETPLENPENVHVVIETGGSREWQAGRLGLEINPGALQRWHYHPADNLIHYDENTFDPEAELPPASMADPETLADFIRWSAEKYPAKKYALVLWDHGGGSRTGIFIDELFDGDTMYLDELHDALAAGGTQLEAVLFDACLMANLETACAIREHARWMIASEEVVAGKGTAMGSWLQQLYTTPQGDGLRLGRWICDMTQKKYAEEADQQTQDTLTWSVTDLSRIEPAAEAFDRFWEYVGRCLISDSAQTMVNASLLRGSFEFGLGGESMRDLPTVFYQAFASFNIEKDIYDDMTEALDRAVVYNIRGNGRSSAGGLSFCYAAGLSPAELDIYARNCPSSHYLAFLDAIHPAWTAPERVYDQAERLPGIQELPDYGMQAEKIISPEGIPGIKAALATSMNISRVHADLYRLNPVSGNTVQLGSTVMTPDVDDDFNLIFTFSSFGSWPALEDVFCNVSFVREEWTGSRLYNIPVQIGTETFLLRCGYDESSEEPLTVYGLWEGYDADSSVFNRNVIQLSQLSGQEFRLLYPIDGTAQSGKTRYETSEPLTMYRSLEMTNRTLEPGTYYLDYWVEDLFLRRIDLGRAEIAWDGQKASVAEASWQGPAETQASFAAAGD